MRSNAPLGVIQGSFKALSGCLALRLVPGDGVKISVRPLLQALWFPDTALCCASIAGESPARIVPDRVWTMLSFTVRASYNFGEQRLRLLYIGSAEERAGESGKAAPKRMYRQEVAHLLV